MLVAALLGLFLPTAGADEAAPPGATPAAKKQYTTGLSSLGTGLCFEPGGIHSSGTGRSSGSGASLETRWLLIVAR